MAQQGSRVGQHLGNYQLERLLGQGGFAEVYLGHHLRLQRQAAIKVLHAHLSAQEVEAFQREAQIIANLDHPNIVRILDFDVQQGVPFLVMDYLPNGTLRQRHAKGERIPLPTVVSYVKQIADALQYAHDQKLIHRDVKPENMLIGRRNDIVLSDFGIAAIAHGTSSMTNQSIAGTIYYMAPEQIQSQARPASDQYALAIVVYEWLSGQRPFDGSYTEIFAKHLMTPPPSLRQKLPELSPEVEQVVFTALAKEPGQRFGRVQAFATALEAAAGVQPLLDPGSARTSRISVGGAPTSSMAAPVDEANPTVQTNDPHVAALPPKMPSAETVTSVPFPATYVAPDGRVAAPTPLSVAQGKTPLPSVPITPGFLPARPRLPAGRAMVLALLALGVVVSGGIWATLLVTTHRPPATPTATTRVTPTLPPYDQFVMKNGMQSGFDVQHSRFNPYESQLSPTTVATLVQAWTATTGAKIGSSPMEANGVIYVGSLDHKLYVFKADGCGQPTCLPLWTASTGDVIDSSPAVVNGVVYVGSNDHKLYAFKADGCGQPTCLPLWTASAGDWVRSSPAVVNGVVYVGSDDGKLYAFKADGCGQPTCLPLWSFATGKSVFSSPAVANGVVYVGSDDHKLYAFKADGCGQSTCAPLWTASTGDVISSSPAVVNGVVYIGSFDHKLYAFKADGCGQSTCSPLWTASTRNWILGSPAVTNGVVYVGSWDDALYAFKADGCGQSTCSPLWTASTGSVISSSPTVANGVVYVGSWDHKLYAFKADGCGQATCLPLWTATTGGMILSSPTVANGVIYIGSDDDKLYAFQRR